MVRNIKWGMIAVGALMWACATDGQGDPGGGAVGNESPIGNGVQQPGNSSQQPGGGATENPRSGGSETPCNVTIGEALSSFSFICVKADECGWTPDQGPIEEGTDNQGLVLSDKQAQAKLDRVLHALPLQRTLGSSSDVGSAFGSACQAITLCSQTPSACDLGEGTTLDDTQLDIDGQLVCITDYIPCFKAIIQALPCDLTAESLQNFAIPAACEGILDVNYDPPV
ncbi:MAG: hypothetical protein AB7K71_05125, partial [Polyangiaceae bacterium]